MSESGTFLPCQPRQPMSVIGGRPADICSMRVLRSLTHNKHIAGRDRAALRIPHTAPFAAVVHRNRVPHFARLKTISARPPEPGEVFTILSSSPTSAIIRRWSLPSAFGKRSPSALVMRVFVASSSFQVPNDATVPAIAALFSSGVPSNRDVPLNLGRSGFTTTSA